MNRFMELFMNQAPVHEPSSGSWISNVQSKRITAQKRFFLMLNKDIFGEHEQVFVRFGTKQQ